MNLTTLPIDLEELVENAAEYDTWSLVRGARLLELAAAELLKLAEKRLID